MSVYGGGSEVEERERVVNAIESGEASLHRPINRSNILTEWYMRLKRLGINPRDVRVRTSELIPKQK